MSAAAVAAAAIDSPYVGLAPFDAAHADYFFGRRLDSEVLADNVLARSTVVLYGASGVGKSSVLNVGLPRALKDEGADVRLVVRRDWHEPAGLADWLDGVLREALAEPGRPLVLVLDQFEEYFLYPSAEQVESFGRALAAAATRRDLEVHLLFSLRDDGLHRLDALRRHLPALLDTTIELRHLDADAVREAVAGPVAVWNRRPDRGDGPVVELDADFADTLIEQLRPKGPDGQPVEGGRVELAYLQLALERIWKAEGGAGAARLRTRTFVEDLKGVGEISRLHVEEVLDRLSEPDRELCATVFDRLVTPSGGKILYRTSDLAQIARTGTPALDAMLAPLASGRSRLLRAVELPGGVQDSGYEILHDILARPILDWRERRVAQAERARADKEEKARLEAEKTAERIRRSNRLLRFFTVAMIVLGGMALYFAWMADRQTRAAEASSRRATALRSAAEASAIQFRALAGNDFRALHQVLAARLLAPTLAMDGAVLDALVRAGSADKVIATGQGYVPMAISPDGSRAAVTRGDAVQIWDPATGRDIGVPMRHAAEVVDVAFSPDGQRLVSADRDGVVQRWELGSGKSLGQTKLSGAISRVAFGPGGRRVFAWVDGRWNWWDPEAGDVRPGPSIETLALAISVDGRRIAYRTSKGGLGIWDEEKGRHIPVSFAKKGVQSMDSADWVRLVAISHDGRRVATVDQSTLRRWDAATGAEIGPPVEGHEQDRSLTFSGDGEHVISGTGDGSLNWWAWNNGQRDESPWPGHKSEVLNNIAVSRDGRRILSQSVDSSIRVWRAEVSPSIAATIKGPPNSEVAAVSPDGTKVLWKLNATTHGLWHVSQNRLTGMPIPSGDATRVALAKDGSRFVTAHEDDVLRLWDTQSGERVGQSPRIAQSLRSLIDISPDGRRIALDSGDATKVWSVDSGTVVELKATGAFVPTIGLDFSNDGSRVVTTGFGEGTEIVRVWAAGTGAQLAESVKKADTLNGSVRFAPDGRIAVGGVSDEFRILDAQGKLLHTLRGHDTQGIADIAWSPDGRLVATLSQDAMLRFWDASNGQQIGVLPVAARGRVTFSDGGRRVMTWERGDDSVRVWPTPSSAAVDVCKRLVRNMSRREWNEWVSPDIPYAKTCPDLPVPAD